MTRLDSRALIICRECVDLKVRRKEVGDNNLGFTCVLGFDFDH
jgi:hypothetical protein